MKKILITGGTGLVGNRLSEVLTDKGVQIHILSRSKRVDSENIRHFQWNLEEDFIEEGALEVDGVIHLAGAAVADKRWTPSRKAEIRDSRTKSTRLLLQEMKKTDSPAQFFVSASAVGYYGNRSDEVLSEDANPGSDFLAEVCNEWEADVFQIGVGSDIAVSVLRIGIVLSSKGGALPKLVAPVRIGIGAYLGNGLQYYPWIHIDDVARMFLYAAEKQLSGVFNATAPTPVSNKRLSKTIAHVLNRPFIPFPAPSFIIRQVLGDRASMLLYSQRTNADKIIRTGFEFNHPDLEEALRDIFRRKV